MIAALLTVAALALIACDVFGDALPDWIVSDVDPEEED